MQAMNALGNSIDYQGIAKRHDCAVIAVGKPVQRQRASCGSACSKEVDGKAAEIDVCLGIGKPSGGNDDEPNTTEQLYISKQTQRISRECYLRNSTRGKQIC